MHDSKLTKLFDRYRAKGDLGALAEVFDAVSPELLRVARHVAGRGNDPEDLVQATFLAAIERALTFDAERPLVPWLMGILINQSRLAKRRARGTNLEAEDLVQAAELRENDAESREIDEAVTRALEGLPDAYRQVLVQHLSEGKKPHEIARDLGRPQGTVRAQIHRGLRLVRKSLPAGFAVGMFGLLKSNALAAVRERVLERAAQKSGLDPSAVARIPRPTSALRPKLVAAGATALVGVAAWLAWPRSSVGNEPDTTLAAPRAGASRTADGLAAPSDGDERTAIVTRTALAPMTGPGETNAGPYGSIAVRVVRASTHAPAAGVRVTLLAWGEPRWFEHVAEARTDAAGEAHFERVHAGRIGLHLDGGTQLRDDVVAGRETRMEAALERGIAVHAVVVDEHGAAQPGAVVEVYSDRDGAPAAVSAPSGPDGAVELPDVDRCRWIAARANGHVPSARVWLGIPSWSTRTSVAVELRVGASGRGIDGLVLDESGAFVANASVRARAVHDLDPAWRADGGVEIAPPAPLATCDAHGRFHLDSLPRGDCVLRAEAPGFTAQELRLEAGDATIVRLQLGRGARVHGSVHFADGSTVANADIELVSENGGASTSARADGHGNFVVENVHSGSVVAQARVASGGPVSTQKLALERGADVEWNPIVEHAQTIEGIALGENGKPVKTWLVFAAPENEGVEPTAADRERNLLEAWTRSGLSPDPGAHVIQCWIGPDGRFSVPCQSGSMHRIELRPRAAWRSGPLAALQHVMPGARDVVLRAGPLRGKLGGHVLDDRGQPIGACTIIVIPSDATSDMRVACDATSGRFDVDLLAGEYEFLAWPEHGCIRRLARRTVALGERIELGEFVIDAPGALRVESADRVGSDLDADLEPDLDPDLDDGRGLHFALRRSAGGAELSGWAADGLPPGAYRLMLHGRVGATAVRDVTIRSRTTTTIRLDRE